MSRMIGVCILLEKNIGPLTKAMYHGGSFSLDINPQSLMRILSVVSVLSRYGCPQVEIYQNREIKCDLPPWTFVQVA